ncbi:MAG: hypothetical protein Q8K02_14625 [Flavobacterium sp.]|nr:hypothetical protein [Flavobacterium sp.]MDP3930669.1 hypothetical protein [Bacteroidota bacterium]
MTISQNHDYFLKDRVHEAIAALVDSVYLIAVLFVAKMNLWQCHGNLSILKNHVKINEPMPEPRKNKLTGNLKTRQSIGDIVFLTAQWFKIFFFGIMGGIFGFLFIDKPSFCKSERVVFCLCKY